MIFKKNLLFLMVLFFTACGDVTSNPDIGASPDSNSSIGTNSTTVTLSGKVTYDYVPFINSRNLGLDYNHVLKKAVRGAVVDVVDGSGTVLATTNTDANGNYSVTLKKGVSVKVRVYSKLYKVVSSGKSSWNFQVKDNTNSNALYVMEGSLVNVGVKDRQTRDLNAGSGWGGSAYTSTRVAAPFAILDVAYQAIQKIRSVDNTILFPPLNIFWSKHNKPASGKISDGDIITSYYDGDSSLYILGDENLDTDEYDSGVIAHEWGHYYESKFSRSDSIGGTHGGGDFLDIRLAFGEGFGNAISSIIRDNPLYWDTSGQQQANGWSMNVETENNRQNPGWFSESSIQRILYDIYDSNDDRGDRLSYGFKPIHQLLIGKEKNTPAFTSIFTFIKGLKDEHPSDEVAIDTIVSQESIAPIIDIYGSGRTNRRENANPLYAELKLGKSTTITTNYTGSTMLSESGRINELGVSNFLKVTIPSNGRYTISITQVGNSGSSDPDFYLGKGASNQPIVSAESPTALEDSVTANLESGIYRMDVIVYRQRTGTRYTLKLVKN